MIDKTIIQKIVVGGVIFNEQGKVLILQRNINEDVYPEMWELPSGICQQRSHKEYISFSGCRELPATGILSE